MLTDLQVILDCERHMRAADTTLNEWWALHRTWTAALARIGARALRRYDAEFTCDCGSHYLGCPCQSRIESGVSDA